MNMSDAETARACAGNWCGGFNDLRPCLILTCFVIWLALQPVVSAQTNCDTGLIGTTRVFVEPVLLGSPPGLFPIEVAFGFYVINSVSSPESFVNVGSIHAPVVRSDRFGNITLLASSYARLGYDIAGMAPGCYQADVIVDTPYEGPTPIDAPFLISVVQQTGALLVDPVPDMISGNAVVSSSQLQGLLSKGTVVQGVAADGSAQLVIRVQGPNMAGHTLTLQLFNDQGSQSGLPAEDGALGSPGTASSSLSENQVTIIAGNGDSSGVAHAFGVYRAPLDFVRSSGKSGVCNGSTPAADTTLTCRSVSVEVLDVTAGNVLVATIPIVIIRPPVILIHGLWTDWKTWNNFSPLITGKNSQDPRFYVGRVSYGNKISGITSTNPVLSSGQLTQITGSSLGVQYNAQSVADQIGALLNDFKNGANPAAIAAAGVQVDVVAHSLGGLVARQLVLVPKFLDPTNLMTGYIHKVITLDSPHLGSPLGVQLLSGSNSCTRRYLADFGNYSLNSATLSNNHTVVGAVADVQGSGVTVDSSLSPTLTLLAAPGPMLLPAALVAGNYTNWTALDCVLCVPGRIRAKCPSDPLAQSLTSDGWPGIFGNNKNDGIVGVTSQLNGAASSSLLYDGLAHSPGIVGRLGLGFSGPSVLDSATGSPSNPAATEVITLLNTPVTQPPYSLSLINP
jgi:pimeloyl-ACP methyl ester carboxylesterase